MAVKTLLADKPYATLEDPDQRRFILTGSHQFELMTQVSQSVTYKVTVLPTARKAAVSARKLFTGKWHMSESNPNFDVSNHEAGQAQHGRGLSPGHGPGLPARPFQSLLAVWPKHVTVVR